MGFACFDVFLIRWDLLFPSSIGGVGRPAMVMFVRSSKQESIFGVTRMAAVYQEKLGAHLLRL
jgi:hypothetical protein